MANKTDKIEVMLSPTEKENIREIADILDVSMSDFVRTVAVDKARSFLKIRNGTMTLDDMLELETANTTYVSLKAASA